MRRSDRLRNRLGIPPAPDNAGGSASMPNLENMGVDQNNVPVNNQAGNIEGAHINPNIGDFIPDEQGQGDEGVFNEAIALQNENLFGLILNNFPPDKTLNSMLSLNKQNSEVSNYYASKYSTFKQISMNKNIRHLKRKLRKLNKGLDEFMEWKGNMTAETNKIKTETLLECSKQLEKFSLKIEEALTLYDADKVGMIDYALESAGGYITSIPDTTPSPSHLSYDVMGLINVQYPSNPRLLIQPGTLPGECFAFKGSEGRIRIRLVHMIDITAVTMEHAHRNLVGDMSSAPKDFKVYGLETSNSERGDELGAFTYSLGERPLQTFYIQKTSEIKKGYEHVELHLLTNQGNPKYTCVYRFRVHGSKIEFLNKNE